MILQNIFLRSLPCLSAVLAAMLAPAPSNAQAAPSAAPTAQPPVAYTSVNQLNGILTPL
jgi:hypothetical protein